MNANLEKQYEPNSKGRAEDVKSARCSLMLIRRCIATEGTG